MSYFECTNCGKKHEIFSNGGVNKVTNDFNLPFLGNIPLLKEIMECGDIGKSYVSNNDDGKGLFNEIIKKIFKELDNS